MTTGFLFYKKVLGISELSNQVVTFVRIDRVRLRLHRSQWSLEKGGGGSKYMHIVEY